MTMKSHPFADMLSSRSLTYAIAPIRQAAISLRSRSDFGLFYFVIILSLLYRILFVVTYPLNDLGYDAKNYLLMILNHNSNLDSAPGYPFFVNIFTFWDSSPYPPSPVFTYSLQFLQHGFELLTLSVLYFFISDIFNKWIAALAIVLVGVDIEALTFTNMTYPEWLWADLLVLSFCTAYRGLVASKDKWKFFYYGLSSALFELCYLTKVNVLVFSLMFGLFYFFDKSLRKRLITLGAILSAAAVYTLFMVSYHYPTTKYHGVTATYGWNLMSKLEWTLGKDKFNNMGINTKKLIALSAILPNNYNEQMSVIYISADAVPSQIRGQYRDKYLSLVNADEKQLDDFLRDHPLPRNFQFMYSAMPIAYYIGLDESNSLSQKVFIEVVINNFRQYVWICLKDAWHAFADYPERRDGLMLPIAGIRPSMLSQAQLDTRQVLRDDFDFGLGFVRYELSDRIHFWEYPYVSTWPILWKPGEKWFSFESRFVMPNGILVLVTGLLILYSYVVISKNGFSIKSAVMLIIATAIPAFIVFSSFVFYFRNKELRLMWPWIGTAYAVVAWWLCSLVYDAFRWGLARAGLGGGSSGVSGKR